MGKKLFTKIEDKNILFEQYKIFVESADTISKRRDTANQFYLALNTAILSIVGYLNIFQQPSIITIGIPIFGILVNFYWREIIISFKSMNACKFDVIHEFEKKLPPRPYACEWDIAKEGKTNKYKPTTTIEAKIPLIFIAFYTITLFFAVYLVAVPLIFRKLF